MARSARITDQQYRLLTWLYMWGFSTERQIFQGLGVKDTHAHERLVRHGCLQKVRAGVLPSVYTLTAEGLSTIAPLMVHALYYPYTDPTALKMHVLRHDLAVQNVVLDLLDTGNISGWEPARLFEQDGQRRGKIPDAVVTTKEGTRYAVELELSSKDYGRQLDGFFSGIADSLDAEEVDGFLVYSPSDALLKKYQKVLADRLKQGALAKWVKDPVSRKYERRDRAIPPAFAERIKWREVAADRVLL